LCTSRYAVRGRGAPVEQVGLAVNEIDDFARQIAVKLLDRPLHVQQHVKALVDRQLRHPQP
jgi:predicted transcriptional regulator